MMAGIKPPSFVKSRFILPPNAWRLPRRNKKARWRLPRQRADECESKCATQASACTVLRRDDDDRDVVRSFASRKVIYRRRQNASSGTGFSLFSVDFLRARQTTNR